MARVWCARMSCMPLFHRRVYNYSKNAQALFDGAFHGTQTTEAQATVRDARRRCAELVRSPNIRYNVMCAAEEYVYLALKVKDLLSMNHRDIPIGFTMPSYLARSSKTCPRSRTIEAVAKEMLADTFMQSHAAEMQAHGRKRASPTYYMLYGDVLSGRTSLMKSVALINALILPTRPARVHSSHSHHVYGSLDHLTQSDLDSLQSKRDMETPYSLYIDDVHDLLVNKVITDVVANHHQVPFAALSFTKTQTQHSLEALRREIEKYGCLSSSVDATYFVVGPSCSGATHPVFTVKVRHI